MRARFGWLLLAVAWTGVGFSANAAVLSAAVPEPVVAAAADLVVSALPDVAASALPDLDVAAAPEPADALYDDLGLDGVIAREVFASAYESVSSRGLSVRSGTLAIADMSQPSTAQRLVIVNLAQQKILLRTWVAHGTGSGGLMAERFSNTHGSHQTSLGLYRVGKEIVSPKHGAALLLAGLDTGVNDQARAREVIIHGADYVSEDFITRTGRLGRSWGCPAVPRAEMTRVISTLADGGLLFVHGA